MASKFFQPGITHETPDASFGPFSHSEFLRVLCASVGESPFYAENRTQGPRSPPPARRRNLSPRMLRRAARRFNDDGTRVVTSSARCGNTPLIRHRIATTSIPANWCSSSARAASAARTLSVSTTRIPITRRAGRRPILPKPLVRLLLCDHQRGKRERNHHQFIRTCGHGRNDKQLIDEKIQVISASAP